MNKYYLLKKENKSFFDYIIKSSMTMDMVYLLLLFTFLESIIIFSYYFGKIVHNSSLSDFEFICALSIFPSFFLFGFLFKYIHIYYVRKREVFFLDTHILYDKKNGQIEKIRYQDIIRVIYLPCRAIEIFYKQRSVFLSKGLSLFNYDGSEDEVLEIIKIFS